MRKLKSSLGIFSAAAVAIVGATAWTVPAAAQQGTLEEVVVTARKREESLQDVPISINAVGAAKLEEAGIQKLEDLQALVPNFQMTETGISTQMYIRGIGSSNNQGFEQSVGMYVDGVYYGRQQLIRAPMFDLERVEVLRGPQIILFGKNSIAGALNMTTAKPTFERTFKANASYDHDFGASTLDAIFSDSITDNLAGRLSIRRHTADGYVRNSLKGEDEVSRDDATVRGQLLWNPIDSMEWQLKAEWSQFNQNGRQIEVIQDDPAGPIDPDGDGPNPPVPNATYAQILALLGHPGGLTESAFDYTRQADAFEKSDNVMRNFTLIGNYDFSNGLLLSSTTAYLEYAFDEICDCDFVGAPVFDLPMSEGFEQISQELRLASPGGETINWQTGLFFQNYDVVFQDMLRVTNNSILPNVSATLGPLLSQGAARVYEADSELLAAFFEAEFNVSERLRFTAGLRFTREDKFGSRVGFVTQLDPVSNEVTGTTTNPASPFLFDFVFGFNNEQLNGHNLRGGRSERKLNPALSVQYDFNDDWMLYGNAGTGFKSGGYDARGNNTGSFEFEEEEANSFEIGAKGKLLDGQMELNISLYNTKYSDLQVSQFDGQIGFNVGNAGEVQARGVEVDGRWAMSEAWTSIFSVAYLDHEYTDFENGNCYNRQTPDGDVVNGEELCSYTGLPGQYTPKVTSSISLDYMRPLQSGYDFRVTTDLSYSSKQNVHVNLDPQYEIDSYAKVNMRFALESDNWTFALTGKNLSNEKVLTYVGNNPLSGSTFFTNTFYGFVAPPRSFVMSASYNF